MVKQTKISTRISAALGLLLIVLLSILGIGVLNQVSKFSYESALDTATAVSEGSAKETALNLRNAESYVNQLNSFVVTQNAAGRENRGEVLEFMKSVLAHSDYIKGIWIATEPNGFGGSDSQYIGSSGSDAAGRFSPYVIKSADQIVAQPSSDYQTDSTSPYYTLPKANDKITLVPPYTWTVDGKDTVMVTLALPVKGRNGEFIGVAGVDIDMARFQEQAEASKPMGGFSAIVSEKDLILAHGAMPELIGKSLSSYDTEASKALKTTNDGKTFNYMARAAGTNENSLKVFSPLPVPGQEGKWAFVTVIREADLLKEYKTLRNTLAVILLVILAVVMTATFWIISRMLKPLGLAAGYLKTIGDLDLSVPLPEGLTNQSGEIGSLVKSVLEMKGRLGGIIEQILAAGSSTVRAVNRLESNVEDMNGHLQEISATTEELTAGMEEASANAEAVYESTDEMSQAVLSLAKRAEIGAETASNIHANADQISLKAAEAIRQASDMYKTTQSRLSEAISDAKNVHRITELSEAILAISVQTNLLALNAAIEAARAGEAGKGFSVVADEIRKLAEESKVTVGEIQQTTTGILASVDSLSSSSTEMLMFIESKVMADYSLLEGVGVEFAEGARTFHDLSVELSATAEELSASVDTVHSSAHIMSQHVTEGAEGSAAIAGATGSIALGSEALLQEALEARRQSESLSSILSQVRL